MLHLSCLATSRKCPSGLLLVWPYTRFPLPVGLHAGGFQSGMGMYGQVPAAFNPSGPEGGAPPGYGWFWGMMGGPGAAGVPAGPPVQGQRASAGLPSTH